jgi:hypothetical protein
LFQGINQLGIGTSEAKERYPADGAAPSDATTEGKSNDAGDEKSAADAATPPADAKAAEGDQPADTEDKSEATSGPALIDGAAAEASDK